jgi:hypothetical protein
MRKISDLTLEEYQTIIAQIAEDYQLGSNFKDWAFKVAIDYNIIELVINKVLIPMDYNQGEGLKVRLTEYKGN